MLRIGVLDGLLFWGGTISYMIPFKRKGICGNVNYIYYHMSHRRMEVISMARLSKAARALLEQILCELNRELAQARVDHDEESIVILEAQVNSTIRELDG